MRRSVALWALVLGATIVWSGALRGQNGCDPATQCCAVDCSPMTPLPTTEQCLADSCSCAQMLYCYIEQNGGPDDWPFWPSGEFHVNLGPVHPPYLEVHVNPESSAAAEEFLDPAIGPVDLPPNTIIYKRNWRASREVPGEPRIDEESPFPTVMFKLTGYCPDDPTAGINCAGGEWFWTGMMGDQITAHGKPTFCINCHGAVQYGDWTWRLFTWRRFPLPPPPAQ